MTTFTSSLPDDILAELNRVATEQKIPKNKVIEVSLKMYFEELEKRKWAAELLELSNDSEIINIAEEAIEDNIEQHD